MTLKGQVLGPYPAGGGNLENPLPGDAQGLSLGSNRRAHNLLPGGQEQLKLSLLVPQGLVLEGVKNLI